MKEKKISGSGRTRNFATVVYPESAPDNWQSILADFCVPSFISPLHDRDVNPDGEFKKPHYHVMLCFDGVKTFEQGKQILDAIGGVGNEVIQSVRGYARYLCHLDNPEKTQYSIDDVRCLSGSDYFAAINLPTDKYKAIKEMMFFCDEHDIKSYARLLMYASDERYDWFRVLCDSATVVIKEYLKSRSWESSFSKKIVVDVETGEIVSDR